MNVKEFRGMMRYGHEGIILYDRNDNLIETIKPFQNMNKSVFDDKEVLFISASPYKYSVITVKDYLCITIDYYK